MSKAFLKQVIKTEPLLMEAVLSFHCQAATWVEASHLTAAAQQLERCGLLDIARQSRRGTARLAAHLPLLATSAPDRWFLEFMDVRSRLALVGSKTLLLLADYVGLGLNSAAIAQVVLQSQVRELKSMFGEAGYTFAVKKAPFMIGSRVPTFRTHDAPLEERIRLQGRACIALCLNEQPQTLRQRLALALPQGFLRLDGIAASAQHPDAAWPLVRRILLKEVAPQWAPCFA